MATLTAHYAVRPGGRQRGYSPAVTAHPEKQAIVDAIRAVLEQEIANLTAAALATREGATHEDAKPENDKDTRAVEAGYLAGAQAKRVRELELTAARLKFLELRNFGPKDGIALGALVEVEGAAHR